MTGELVTCHREDPAASELLSQPLRGHFAKLGETVGVLYRLDGRLHLRLGDHELDVDDENVKVRWSSSSGAARRLDVTDRLGEVVATVNYCVSGGPVAVMYDVTPFVHEEDFDFGQFVTRVLDDPGRRKRIYR
jgi:hypothetical protein